MESYIFLNKFISQLFADDIHTLGVCQIDS